MTWSDLPLRPSGRMLRQFAGLWLVFFVGLAAWQYIVRDNPTAAAVLAGLAVTVGTLGLLKPSVVRPIFIVWMVVAFPIGWVVSTALLTLTYYVLFTPIGWAFRLAGRDPLRLRPQAGLDSYWVPRPVVTNPHRYFQQF